MSLFNKIIKPFRIFKSKLAILIFFSIIYFFPSSNFAHIQGNCSPYFDNLDTLSFYFQDIEIRTLLQLIAKSSGMNFVISDAVKGSTTLNLQNVTWRQALNIVMKSHGLTARESGNVIYVSTIEDLTNNETKLLQARLNFSTVAPLETAMICLRYANAKEVTDFLKGQQGTLLTPRGQIVFDLRTNSLIVRDISSNLSDVVNAIKRLDVPARQVLIEARIVTIDTTFEEQLGVRFGLTSKGHVTGTFAGANQIAQGISLPNIIPPTNRLNFNNPASQLESGANPGSIAVALAKIGGVFLDMELSAIEEEGHGQIISSPHVITANLQKARIQTGEEIPYQEATSSGATAVAFKKAVLSLEIIPQITPNNKIILHLKATEDSRGQQLLVSPGTTVSGTPIPPVLGPPVINSHEVESHILLNNCQTIVVGGVYKHTKVNTVDRIPFLGYLPVVGYLFRSSRTANARQELLIFITPKIINNLSYTPDEPHPRFKMKLPCKCAL